MINERRKVARYLCSDDFSESKLTISSQEYNLMSINFNRYGIALYSHKRLPELSDNEECSISFDFKLRSEFLQVENLSCRIKNRHETEVGSQYGFKIIKQDITDDKVVEMLVAIEKQLEEDNNSENRYGLFD